MNDSLQDFLNINHFDSKINKLNSHGCHFEFGHN